YTTLFRSSPNGGGTDAGGQTVIVAHRSPSIVLGIITAAIAELVLVAVPAPHQQFVAGPNSNGARSRRWRPTLRGRMPDVFGGIIAAAVVERIGSVETGASTPDQHLTAGPNREMKPAAGWGLVGGERLTAIRDGL